MQSDKPVVHIPHQYEIQTELINEQCDIALPPTCIFIEWNVKANFRQVINQKFIASLNKGWVDLMPHLGIFWSLIYH